MANLNSLMLAGALGLGVVALSGGASYAAIVCNQDGDCWHTTQTYVYPSESHIVIRPDNWKWKSDEKYRWHEHEGRGYWNGGSWRDF